MMRQTLYTRTLLLTLAISSFFLVSFSDDAAEIGKCGFYADTFQGRPTASGEKYNKDYLTCAHKTLPFGTRIRVTRLDNKKSVVVRVNDRGPFIEGYIVDLSRAAAREIGLFDGHTRVKIEMMETAVSAAATDAVLLDSDSAPASSQVPEASAKPVVYSKTTAVNTSPKGAASSNTTTVKSLSTATDQPATKVAPSSSLYKVDIAQTEKSGFGIQITSLSDANNVLPIVKELQARYPDKVLVNVIRDEFNNPTYKIIVGPYADRKTAETTQKSVAKKYKKTLIVDLSGV
jgi:rare lipoprotein A